MVVSSSAFNASADQLSGSDAFPFFSFSIVFLTSFLVGLSMLIGMGIPFSSMTGLSVCWYAPANFLVMSCRPLCFSVSQLLLVLPDCQCGRS